MGLTTAKLLNEKFTCSIAGNSVPGRSFYKVKEMKQAYVTLIELVYRMK
jgi:hypothetical protein